MTKTIFVLLTSIALDGMSFAQEIPQSYSTLQIPMNKDIVKINILEVNYLKNGDINPAETSPRSALVNITCDTMCGGGYTELVQGCSFGAFQFTPGSNDIVTEWVPYCMQPFRVIIYNVSSAGVRKVLDTNSGAPPQFILGRTEHCDVRIFKGTLGDLYLGHGRFQRWAWNGDHYEPAED